MINICENCGTSFEDKKFKRFCSLHCARSYSTKFLNHNELKHAKCSICGADIQIKKNANSKTCKCNICKANRICHLCGSSFNVAIDRRCKNNFCAENANGKIQQIKTLIKYFGFDKTKLGTLEVEKEYNRIRKILEDDIWKFNLTTGQICKKYNYPYVNNLHKIFKYLNIKTRNLSDAIKLNYFNNTIKINTQHTIYKSGWHTTWNNKKVYLRSSYELDYANQLDEQKINYEVESLRIKYINSKDNKEHCAIPDFYIPDLNLIIEIKSNWTFDNQEMIDKFKAYKNLGYNCKLILEHKEINLTNFK